MKDWRGDRIPVGVSNAGRGRKIRHTRFVDGSNYICLMQSESQPRKSSRVISCDRTKTDTGRWGEKPQALGRTLVKELGKLAP